MQMLMHQYHFLLENLHLHLHLLVPPPPKPPVPSPPPPPKNFPPNPPQPGNLSKPLPLGAHQRRRSSETGGSDSLGESDAS
ncbi:hypothetical protein H5410_038134 [Solanum commersonii]|uniref:Uncharacterized protein n=1 Tax=Solanum commersonii TaxID=4109 RepID=A0A9J5YD35_SOLCO|nr:hypothetical protein H5410_038134 [Solanum commersonii]